MSPTRRHALLALLSGALPLPALAVDDRCGQRADAALTRIVGDLLPHFGPCMFYAGSIAGAVTPGLVRAGRARSSRALTRWHKKVLDQIHSESEQRKLAWASVAPKGLRHASIIDMRGDSAVVTCPAQPEVDQVLTSEAARQFWAAQQRVLARAPGWVLAGLTEYLREPATAPTFDAAVKQAGRTPQLPVYPLPFGMESANVLRGLLAVARVHGREEVQVEIRDEEAQLQTPRVPLKSREMKVVEHALVTAWRTAMPDILPQEANGQAHLNFVAHLSVLLEVA